MGVCASSGGFYRAYHVMQGIDEIVPVDVYVPGCPPSPEGLLAAIMKIQERIKKGEQAKEPQRAHRLGSPGEGAIDRRERRQEWAKDDAARRREGKPPRGVLELRVIQEPLARDEHHG
jgi:NADH:ubiquinone oxidoreductase subunit B-like Fe-S oxidoreductase